jgi:hypothetical protein
LLPIVWGCCNGRESSRWSCSVCLPCCHHKSWPRMIGVSRTALKKMETPPLFHAFMPVSREPCVPSCVRSRSNSMHQLPNHDSSHAKSFISAFKPLDVPAVQALRPPLAPINPSEHPALRSLLHLLIHNPALEPPFPTTSHTDQTPQAMDDSAGPPEIRRRCAGCSQLEIMAVARDNGVWIIKNKCIKCLLDDLRPSEQMLAWMRSNGVIEPRSWN